MIDFSAYKGWAIPEGVVTQIADEAGMVLWKKITAGSVIWRPIADMEVKHARYPTNITDGYRLINEEVSDGDATYIHSNGGTTVSEFLLGGGDLPRGAIVTSVTIYAVPWSGSNSSAKQEISLELIDVASLGSVTLYADPAKNFDGSLLGAVEPINNYISSNNAMPPLNLHIESHSSSSSKGTSNSTGLTQVYVVLGYEA